MEQEISVKNLAYASLIAIGALAAGATAHAETADKDVFGWVEKVSIEPWGAELKAKLDTGALTSSMHATDIKVYEKDGEDWVSFTVDVEDQRSGEKVKKHYKKPLYRDLTVRGAGGRDERPVVLMKVCAGGTIHEEQFSLRDREEMIYPVLFGRRTIQHLGVVDVTRTFINDPECTKDSPVQVFDPDESDEDIGD
tara:strand:+ start:76325 stop:76909 length:585 start_codon:yes stop_codon:yes gene_type:complete